VRSPANPSPSLPDTDLLTQAIPAVRALPRERLPKPSGPGPTASGPIASWPTESGRWDPGIGTFPAEDELISPATPPARIGLLLLAVAAGTLVSVGLGVYGRLHEPTFAGLSVAGFSSGTAAKAWLASGAFALVLVQLGSAVLMYRTALGWVGTVHRWSGRAAVLLTVPIAVHCLYALGFQLGSTRVLAHSLAGCFVYGLFVAKMLVLPRPDVPRWSIPVLGGLLFTALTALWATSSLWFFGTSGIVF
jgi:Family of unknown function (DUF6529)